MNVSLKNRGKVTNKKKGFSLFEVLVASSIFAVILIIATEVFGTGSTYNVKMKEMRRVGEGSRKLADMITNDIRQANATGTIIYHPSSGGANTTYTFKNGLALMNCQISSPGLLCNLIDNATPENTVLNSDSRETTSPTKTANVLIIFNKNWTKVYYSEYSAVFGGSTANGYNLFLREYNPARTTAIDFYQAASASNTIYADLASQGETYKLNKSISGGVGEARVLFDGCAPDDNSTALQPYINMDVLVRSATNASNYDSLPLYKKATAEIWTTVTSRSYNQQGEL